MRAVDVGLLGKDGCLSSVVLARVKGGGKAGRISGALYTGLLLGVRLCGLLRSLACLGG